MSTLLFLLLAGPCVAVRQSTHDQPSVGEYEIQGQRIRLTQVGEIGDGEDIRWAKPERPQSQKAAAENLMETKAEVRGCPSGAEVWEETGKTLGSGAMGKVVEVESKVHSGGKYAMKLPFEGAVEEAELEVKVMRAARQQHCRHVISLTAASPCVSTGLSSNELMSASYIAPEMKGDLHHWVHGPFKELDKATRQMCAERVIRQLFSGMLCLHEAGYIHGDLKGDNVFYEGLDRDGCPTGVVLADFGSSMKVGLPMQRYSKRYYEGSGHLPGSIFTGIKDTLEIGRGMYHAIASTDIDKCSLSYLAYSYFKTRITGMEPKKGSCGPMGRRSLADGAVR